MHMNMNSTSPPAPTEPLAEDKILGAKLRAYRKTKNLTLNAVADLADLSIGQLSQIERGLSSPSLRTLRAICHAVGIDGAELFVAEEPAMRNNSEYAVRSNARRKLKFKDLHVTKFRITPVACQDMEVYLLNIEEGGSSGEKLGFVISGHLEFFVEGEKLSLSEGDSFGCRAGVPHKWCNGWQGQTTILLVNNAHFYV